MFRPAARLLILLLTAVSLSACAVASAGISKGDERSFVGSLNDVNAGRTIKARLKRAHDYELGGIDVEVAEGVVLLSGNVPRQEGRIEAARIAWSAPHIVQVGNEIMIKGKQGFVRNAKDGFLEKSIRARLAVDKYVKGRNFNIETHDGIVYLLGVARTARELDRAARIAAFTKGAREVISYARIADVPIEVQEEMMMAEIQAWEDLPDQDRTDNPAPMRRAPDGEPIPYSTPEQISPYDLGLSDTPQDPNVPLFYIDPETGQQIQVKTPRQVTVPTR